MIPLPVSMHTGQIILLTKLLTVEPEPGTLLVHVGEILAFATQGRFCATPHRVINRQSDRSRLSIPIFLNLSLQTVVTPIAGASPIAAGRTVDDSHVHRVLSPVEPGDSFLFGRQSGAGRVSTYGARSV